MAFVLKKTLKPQVIKPSNDSPNVIKAELSSDAGGNLDHLLTLECYCNLHVLNFIKNSTTSAKANQIKKIDIHFAPHDIEFYKRKASTSSVKKVLANDNKLKTTFSLNKKNATISTTSGYQGVNSLSLPNPSYTNSSSTMGTSLSPQQILQAVTNGSSHRLERAKNIFQGTLKVGSFDLTEIDNSSVEMKKKIQISSIENSIANDTRKSIQQSQTLNSSVFSSIYKKMVIGGKDPASLFKDHYLKTSKKLEHRGQTSRNRKRKTEDQKIFEPIFLSFTNQIRSLSNKTIKFDYYEEQEDTKRLTTTVNISHNKLKRVAKGNTVHVLLIARSENNIKIESFSFPFNISTIDDQINQTSRDYDISTTRLNSNTSILSVGNNNAKKELSVNMYGKRVGSLIPFEYSYYKQFEGANVLPGNKVIYKDGELNSPQRTAGSNNFGAYDTALYRTTFNFKGKQYFNADSVTDTRRKTTDNIPHLVVLGRVLNGASEFIRIRVENISSNVKSIRVLKKKFKGDTQYISRPESIEYLVSETGEIQNNFNIVTSKNLVFDDYDIYRTSVYKYYVECIMQNGERKVAPNFFIERFEEKGDIVNIDNIVLDYNVDRSETIETSKLGNFNSVGELTKNVTINFDVIQNDLESEKLLETLFGDLFDLYKEQLQSIREGIQPLVYSIEITRQNHLSGEHTTIGTVSPDSQGKCSFIDSTCPIFADVTYKFNPRAIPAGDLIDLINEQIPLYAKKDIFRSGRLVAGSQIKAIEKSRNKVLSSVGRKYSKRSTFLKGLVESDKATYAKQGGTDVFHGSSTGDIVYKELSGINVFSNRKPGLTIKNTTVFEVKELDPTRDKRLTFKNRGTQIQRGYLDVQGYRVGNRRVPGSPGQIIRSLPEIKLINFKLCDVSFDIIGNDFFVDFYAVLVKENNFVYLDGIMHSTDDLSNQKSYSYLFEHEGSYGLIEYYLVPIYKDGTLGVPSLIGANQIT